MSLYSSIQAARDVITAARADIEANRQSAGPADEDVEINGFPVHVQSKQ